MKKLNFHFNKIKFSDDDPKLKNYSLRFASLIEKASMKNKQNLDWWVSSVASRNTHISSLFKKYLFYLFIQNDIKKYHEIEKINADIHSINLIFCKIPKNSQKFINYIFYKINICKNVIRLFLYFIFELIKKVSQLYIARITKINTEKLPSQPLTILDIFASPGYYQKDRYFTNLYDYLTKEEKKTVYFVPTIVLTKPNNLLSAFRELRSSKLNIILREDYLNLSDIFYSVSHCLRRLFLKINPIIEDKLDLSPLIYEELKSLTAIDASIEGLLNYRFIMRLKEKGIKLKIVIDWWESQPYDKGLHYALHKFFPDVKVKGYLGFVPRNMEIQLCTTKYETESHVVPETINVTGHILEERLKILNPKQKVTKAPAFRFQHVWEKNKKLKKNKEKIKILIALTALGEESFQILKFLNNCFKNIIYKNLDILVKPHPVFSGKEVRNWLGNDWPKKFKISENSSEKLLKDSEILITGMSSVAIEAMAMCIPVIIISKSVGFVYNPVPFDIPKEIFRICISHKEFKMNLKYFIIQIRKNPKIFRNIGTKIRKDYFEPTTRMGVKKFLNI